MSNFLNNTSDLEKIYNEVDGIDDLMTEQDNLIAQITTALDGKTGDSSAPTYTTIETTVTLSGNEVVIPDLIGKTFFIIAVDDTMPLKSVKPEDEEIFELVYMNGQFYKSGSELFGT